MEDSGSNPVIFDLTKCIVCEQGEDEDLILVCDGPGCINEVHMSCLNPPLTVVPEGDWFCPICNEKSETEKLELFLAQYESSAYMKQDQVPKSDSAAASVVSHGDLNQVMDTLDVDKIDGETADGSVSIISPSPAEKRPDKNVKCSGIDKDVFIERLFYLQRHRVPLLIWEIKMDEIQQVFKSEFESSSMNLIGCTVSVKDYINYDVYNGRIIGLRKCPYIPNRFEHLVQFKSGGDSRNTRLIKWLCLDEIPCTIGVELVWTKLQGYPYWPSLRCCRSGMDLAESTIVRPSYAESKHSFRFSNTQKEIDRQYDEIQFEVVEPTSTVHLFFYGEESTFELGQEEAKSIMVPYLHRPRDLKPNMRNKLAGAIALANVEFEERQNTRRSYQIYPQSFMEKNGSTYNVETLRFLKSLSSKEKPSDNSFSSQFQYCREILKENTLKFCKLGMSSQTKSSNDGIKVESNPTSEVGEDIQNLYFSEPEPPQFSCEDEDLVKDLIGQRIIGLNISHDFYGIQNQSLQRQPISFALIGNVLDWHRNSGDSNIHLTPLSKVLNSRKRPRDETKPSLLNEDVSDPIEVNSRRDAINDQLTRMSDVLIRPVSSFSKRIREKYSIFTDERNKKRLEAKEAILDARMKQLEIELQEQLDVEKEEERVTKELETEDAEQCIMIAEDFMSREYESHVRQLVAAVNSPQRRTQNSPNSRRSREGTATSQQDSIEIPPVAPMINEPLLQEEVDDEVDSVGSVESVEENKTEKIFKEKKRPKRRTRITMNRKRVKRKDPPEVDLNQSASDTLGCDLSAVISDIAIPSSETNAANSIKNVATDKFTEENLFGGYEETSSSNNYNLTADGYLMKSNGTRDLPGLQSDIAVSCESNTKTYTEISSNKSVLTSAFSVNSIYKDTGPEQISNSNITLEKTLSRNDLQQQTCEPNDIDSSKKPNSTTNAKTRSISFKIKRLDNLPRYKWVGQIVVSIDRESLGLVIRIVDDITVCVKSTKDELLRNISTSNLDVINRDYFDSEEYILYIFHAITNDIKVQWSKIFGGESEFMRQFRHLDPLKGSNANTQSQTNKDFSKRSDNSSKDHSVMNGSQRSGQDVDNSLRNSFSDKLGEDSTKGGKGKQINGRNMNTTNDRIKDINHLYVDRAANSSSNQLILPDLSKFPKNLWKDQFVTTKYQNLVGKVIEVVDDHHARVNVIDATSKDVPTADKVFEISMLFVLDKASMQSLDYLRQIFHKSFLNITMLHEMLTGVETLNGNRSNDKYPSNTISNPSAIRSSEEPTRVIFPVPYQLSHITKDKWRDQIVTTQRRKILGKVKSIVNDTHVIVKLIQSSSLPNTEQCIQVSILEVLDRQLLGSKEYIRYIFKDMTPFQHLLKGPSESTRYEPTNTEISQIKQFEGSTDKSASSWSDVKAFRIVNAVADMVNNCDESSINIVDQKTTTEAVGPTMQLLTMLSKDTWMNQIVTTKRRKFVGKVTKVINDDHVILNILLSHNGNDRSVYLKTQFLEVMDKSQILSFEYIKAIFTGSVLNVDDLFNILHGRSNIRTRNISSSQESIGSNQSINVKESDQDIWNHYLYSDQYALISPGDCQGVSYMTDQRNSPLQLPTHQSAANEGNFPAIYGNVSQGVSTHQSYVDKVSNHGNMYGHESQNIIKNVCEKYLSVGVIDDTQLTWSTKSFDSYLLNDGCKALHNVSNSVDNNSDPNLSNNYYEAMAIDGSQTATNTNPANDPALYTQQHYDSQNISNEYAAYNNMQYSHFSSKVDQFLDCIFNNSNNASNISDFPNVHVDPNSALTPAQSPGNDLHSVTVNNNLYGAISESYEFNPPNYGYDANSSISQPSLNITSNEQYAISNDACNDGIIDQKNPVNSRTCRENYSPYLSAYQETNGLSHISENIHNSNSPAVSHDKLVHESSTAPIASRYYDKMDQSMSIDSHLSHPEIHSPTIRQGAYVRDHKKDGMAKSSSMTVSSSNETRMMMNPLRSYQPPLSQAPARTELSQSLSPTVELNGMPVDYLSKSQRKRLKKFCSSVTSIVTDIERYFLAGSSDRPNPNATANETSPKPRLLADIVEGLSRICRSLQEEAVVDSIRIEILRQIVNQLKNISQVSSLKPNRRNILRSYHWEILHTMRDKWLYLYERNQNKIQVNQLPSHKSRQQEREIEEGEEVEDMNIPFGNMLTESSISALHDTTHHTGFIEWRDKKYEKDLASKDNDDAGSPYVQGFYSVIFATDYNEHQATISAQEKTISNSNESQSINNSSNSKDSKANKNSQSINKAVAQLAKYLENYQNSFTVNYPLLETHFSSSTTDDNSNIPQQESMKGVLTSMSDRLLNVCNRSLSKIVIDSINIGMLRSIFNYVDKFVRGIKLLPNHFIKMSLMRYQLFRTMQDKWLYIIEKNQINMDISQTIPGVSLTTTHMKEREIEEGEVGEVVNIVPEEELTESSISTLHDITHHAGFIEWRNRKYEKDLASKDHDTMPVTEAENTQNVSAASKDNEKASDTIAFNIEKQEYHMPTNAVTEMKRLIQKKKSKLRRRLATEAAIEAHRLWKSRRGTIDDGDDDDDRDVEYSDMYSSSDSSDSDSCSEPDSSSSYSSDESPASHRERQRMHNEQLDRVSHDPIDLSNETDSVIITENIEDVEGTSENNTNHEDIMNQTVSNIQHVPASLSSSADEDNNRHWTTSSNYISPTPLAPLPAPIPPPSFDCSSLIMSRHPPTPTVIVPSLSSFFEPPPPPSLDVPESHLITPQLNTPSFMQDISQDEYYDNNDMDGNATAFHDIRYQQTDIYPMDNAVNIFVPSVHDLCPQDMQMDISNSINYPPTLQVPSIDDLNYSVSSFPSYSNYVQSQPIVNNIYSNQYIVPSNQIADQFDAMNEYQHHQYENSLQQHHHY